LQWLMDQLVEQGVILAPSIAPASEAADATIIRHAAA